MRLVAITPPEYLPQEGNAIAAIIESGAAYVHIRKPGTGRKEMEALLRSVPERLRGRIVLHDMHELAADYGVGGIHLNRRNGNIPGNFTGRISVSCHTLEETVHWKDKCDYLFLSPVFDSISKPGYMQAFSPSVLREARESGTIDRKVLALGGITPANAGKAMAFGFGGAAVLGWLWEGYGPDRTEFLKHKTRCLKQALRPHPAILSIAGSDCSGGAGIQADIKAISALGGYAATAITAVTAQNTKGVAAILPVSAGIVADQIESVFEDILPDAVKIGMVTDGATAEVIASAIRTYRPEHIVYDPVMVSTSGSRLMQDGDSGAIVGKLISQASLITPNIPEAEALYGRPVRNIEQMTEAAAEILKYGCGAVLVKGGHLEGCEAADVLVTKENRRIFRRNMVDSRNTHGTGCTLSSAIATLLASGEPVEDAVKKAGDYVHKCIVSGTSLNIGYGHGPLWHFPDHDQVQLPG
ncbi:MAG TPA: bifunctional hydroxymethylpyrimidine kinase/phosphomethylpyrimidine kinase [Candidatus Coprenecus stercoripullorum]|nr:bifunctional hydroxymethylpyrimidine kinase/phosphomethylpyrimidine kinase [Candidatus Coprenecus stercoripullorum]